MEASLQELRGRLLEPDHKAMPPGFPPVTIDELSRSGWSSLKGDLPLPLMVLKESPLSHNLQVMQDFCRRHRLELAPHGKTTMAPQLVHRQLMAGAWGVTVGTTAQAAVYHRFGVPRIILANQLLDRAGIRWAAGALSDGAELYCLVDSVKGVQRLDQMLSETGVSRQLSVLVEVGVIGARAGCRTSDQVTEVVNALVTATNLRLVGIEAFEGVIGSARDFATVSRVQSFLARFRLEAERVMQMSASMLDGPFIVTAGGSTYPDLVAEALGNGWSPPNPTQVILRSGCYLTHDHGLYAAGSPFGDTAVEGYPQLQPALEVWGMVLSRPEPDLAIVGFGKRDVPYDAGLPTPVAIASPGEPPSRVAPGMVVTNLNDQHAMMRVPNGLPLEPGDLVGCGISHPCTAFDKWSLIPVVNEEYDVIDAIRTYF